MQFSFNSDEEEDIFQCGRCKKQFTSLQSFITHKSNCKTIRVQQQPQAPPTQQQVAPAQQQVPQSTVLQAAHNQTYQTGVGNLATQIIKQVSAACFGVVRCGFFIVCLRKIEIAR